MNIITLFSSRKKVIKTSKIYFAGMKLFINNLYYGGEATVSVKQKHNVVDGL